MTRRPIVRYTAMTERQMQDGIVEAARRLDYLVYFTWRSIHSPAGFPDLVLCGRRRLIFIEVKGPRGRFRVGQEEWLARLTAVGVETYVIRPADYDALLADLQEWAA